MSMSNSSPDTSLKTPAPISTLQNDSEARFDDNSHSQGSSPPSGSQRIGVSPPDLILSVPLDPDTSTPSPLAGPSSLKMTMCDMNNTSGSKRKQDDADGACQAEDNSHERKKPKQESLEDGASSFVAPGHTSDAADAESLEPERPGSPSLDDGLSHSKVESSESASPLPDAPSSLSRVPIDLPPPLTPPPRSQSAPPTSPVAVDVTTRAYPLPPPSSRSLEPEPLHTYTCPICFSSPTNATLTPCGHIMCGECLFTAVGAAAVRMGIAALAARCPVCRAPIPRWDGRGGGVIGLQPRVLITI